MKRIDKNEWEHEYLIKINRRIMDAAEDIANRLFNTNENE